MKRFKINKALKDAYGSELSSVIGEINELYYKDSGLEVSYRFYISEEALNAGKKNILLETVPSAVRFQVTKQDLEGTNILSLIGTLTKEWLETDVLNESGSVILL